MNNDLTKRLRDSAKHGVSVPDTAVEAANRIDTLEEQLDTERKRNVMLRSVLTQILWDEDADSLRDLAKEALAATGDLKDAILCNREPVGTGWLNKNKKLIAAADDGPTPLHTPWEPSK